MSNVIYEWPLNLWPNSCMDTQTFKMSMDPQTSNMSLKVLKTHLYICFDNARLIENYLKQSNVQQRQNS